VFFALFRFLFFLFFLLLAFLGFLASLTRWSWRAWRLNWRFNFQRGSASGAESHVLVNFIAAFWTIRHKLHSSLFLYLASEYLKHAPRTAKRKAKMALAANSQNGEKHIERKSERASARV
jgi:hypothetical protein